MNKKCICNTKIKNSEEYCKSCSKLIKKLSLEKETREDKKFLLQIAENLCDIGLENVIWEK